MKAPKLKHNEIIEGWSPLVKLCCAKFTNQASIKDMIESHQIKENVLDRIMEKFTKGSKLKRFDLYMKDEQDRSKMAGIKKEVQKDYEMSEKHLAELKRKQMA